MKNKSITSKILIPLTLVIMLQGAFFAISFIFGGAFEGLKANSINSLDYFTEYRSQVVEQEIANHWTSFQESYDVISTKLKNAFQENGDFLQESTSANEVIQSISQELIYMLRKSSATGSFIILDYNDTSIKRTLYFRDLDPTSNPTNNSDLLSEFGSATILKEIRIPMDTEWQSMIDISKSTSADFYEQAMNIEFNPKNVNIQNVGFWSKPFKLTENDLEIITYTVPLVDHHGNSVGVLGIELTTDYLKKYLPSKELNKDSKGTYCLATIDYENTRYSLFLCNGYSARGLLTDKNFHVEKINDFESVFVVEDASTVYYSSAKPIKMYNSNNPFEKQKWILISFEQEKELFSDVLRMRNGILISTLVVTVGGALLIFILLKRITDPITGLVKKVKKSDPSKKIELGRTRIDEIDELAKSIENLSVDVAEASDKFSHLIELSGVSLGVFEYYEEKQMVQCSSYCFEIFGLEVPESYTMIDIEYFQEKLSELLMRKDPENEEWIYFINKEGKKEYVRYVENVTDEGTRYGVLINVTSDVIERKVIEYERDHDVLTGLMNRRYLERMVKKILFSDELKLACMVTWDLDSLKFINDTYGHDFGDSYIIMMAHTLNLFSSENTIVGRISGDEFILFSYGYDDKNQMRKLISKIHKTISEQSLGLPDGKEIRLRCSGGIAYYPEDAVAYETLYRYADYAMYRVKNDEKGHLTEFKAKEYEQDAILFESREELNNLLENELVDFALQPVVSCIDGEIHGFEALMRPQIATFKNPTELLRVARSQAKLGQIEKITLFKAMDKMLGTFKETNQKIFINSLPSNALPRNERDSFAKKYADSLKRIVFEITEVDQTNEEMINLKLSVMRSWGCQLAIDDFGTGYNSEMMLLSTNPDYIKIDIGIIKGIHNDLSKQKLFVGTVEYAKMNNIKIIAEGVETFEEMKYCIENGADYLQGYYTGRPNLQPIKIDPQIVEQIKIINKNKVN